MKPGNWHVAPKLRQQQADPVTPLLGQFGGEERGRQEAHKLSHSAAKHQRPSCPPVPKAGLKTASLPAAESATDPFFFFGWNIGKFPINSWAPCFSHKIRRSILDHSVGEGTQLQGPERSPLWVSSLPLRVPSGSAVAASPGRVIPWAHVPRSGLC